MDPMMRLRALEHLLAGGASGSAQSEAVRRPTPEEYAIMVAQARQAQRVREIQAYVQQLQSEAARVQPDAPDARVVGSVLSEARRRRDAADYVRILSSFPELQSAARHAALPTLLTVDAFTGEDAAGTRQRDAIVRVLANMYAPAYAPSKQGK